MVSDDTQLLDVDVEPFRPMTIADTDHVLRYAAAGQSL